MITSIAKNTLIRLANSSRKNNVRFTLKSVERVPLASDMIGQMAILRVHVIPNAKRDCIVGEHRGAIKIKLRAPAVEGKANAALLRFLAEEMKLPRRAIALQSGQRSRDKLLRIDGLSEEEVRRRWCMVSPEDGAPRRSTQSHASNR